MTSIRPVGPKANPEVRDAIQVASRRTGVSFEFLVKQAETESGFDQRAKATTSSATGLYQFLEGTWLSMVRQHGARHGMATEAAAIEVGRGGAPRVADPETRARILELRNDPRFAASMAAEYTKESQNHLRGTLGREPSATDLYFAHFFGPHGAGQFLRARDADGSKAGADLLPEAAAANRAVFYAGDGRARTMDEIYARFEKRFDSIATQGPAAPEIVEAVARTNRGSEHSPALLAAPQTRVSVLQALSARGLAPITVVALAALEDREGRTVAGRLARRGMV